MELEQSPDFEVDVPDRRVEQGVPSTIQVQEMELPRCHTHHPPAVMAIRTQHNAVTRMSVSGEQRMRHRTSCARGGINVSVTYLIVSLFCYYMAMQLPSIAYPAQRANEMAADVTDALSGAPPFAADADRLADLVQIYFVDNLCLPLPEHRGARPDLYGEFDGEAAFEGLLMCGEELNRVELGQVIDHVLRDHPEYWPEIVSRGWAA